MIDVAAVAAIDTHVHIERPGDGHDTMPRYLGEAAARWFASDPPLPTVDNVADHHRECNMAARLRRAASGR